MREYTGDRFGFRIRIKYPHANQLGDPVIDRGRPTPQ